MDRRRVLIFAGPAAAAGAAIMFFLDRSEGSRRRAMTRQRVGGVARRVVRRGGRAARYAGTETAGMARRAVHPRQAQEPPPDDVTLARKVETEIFRAADVPKGSINVNAEAGLVYLRGKADTPERIRQLEDQAHSIPGVRDVRNLLSLPATPAKTKV